MEEGVEIAELARVMMELVPDHGRLSAGLIPLEGVGGRLLCRRARAPAYPCWWAEAVLSLSPASTALPWALLSHERPRPGTWWIPLG